MNPEFINGPVNYIKLSGTIANSEKEIHIFVDRKTNNENIKYLKTNSKVRLHYFDIRDHLDIFYLTKIINKKIDKYINLLNDNKENDIKNLLF